MRLGQRGITLARRLKQGVSYNATGVIRSPEELKQRGEGRWLPTPGWDLNQPPRAEDDDDLCPHLIRIEGGRALLRTSDEAYFTLSRKIIGFGTSSWFTEPCDHFSELEQHPYYRPNPLALPFEWLPEPIHYQGPVFVAHSPWSHNNYYHFLLGFTAKLGLFADSDLSAGEVPVVTCLSLRGYRAEILQRIGITPINHGRQSMLHLSADRLFTASMRRHPNNVSAEAVRFLRRLFQHDCQPNHHLPRRLLIRRGPSRARSMHNEEAIAANLEQHGFTSLWPERMSVSEQARHFASADIIIGQHGAALVNLAFCRPGTKVIELHGQQWYNQHYQNLAALADLDYQSVLCRSEPDHSLIADPDLLDRLDL